MKRVCPQAIKAIATVCLMVAVFFVLSLLASTIPSGNIKQNVLSSIETIEEEGLKHRIGNIFLFRLDNFTDALMLNIAQGIDAEKPVESAVKDTYYLKDDRMSILSATKDIAENKFDDVYPTDYARYWHGYLVLLRPLLLFTDYTGIRTINYICFGLIIIGLYLLMHLNKHHRTLLTAFIASLAAINFPMIPLSMQFSTVFYISFITSAVIIRQCNKGQNAKKNLCSIFLITGGVTAFFDLLTVPLVTLCLPLTLFLYTSDTPTRSKYRQLLSSAAAWAAGYCSVWTSKWLIAAVTTGYDITDAISAAIMRTSTEYDDYDMSFYGIFCFLKQYPLLLTTSFAAAALLIAFYIYLYLRSKKAFVANSWLLVIAAMPFAWCIVLRNHSVIHHWFVWRIFFISIMANLLFLSKIIGKQRHAKLSSVE